LVEGAELAERALGRGEEVTHEVLDAAGEQVADALGALENRTHPLGELTGVAVGVSSARDFLELIEEHHHGLAVRLRDPAREGERVVEITLRIARGQAGVEGDLELLPELSLRLDDRRHACGIRHQPPCAAGLMNDSPERGAVGDGLGDQHLGELGRGGDSKQVDGDHLVCADHGA
jgi:hypothetical protein